MLTLEKIFGLFLIFLVVSPEENNYEEETKQIMEFINERETFLRNINSLKVENRIYSNSTLNDLDDVEEPTSRMLCLRVLKRVSHCARGMPGWGCGICGRGCTMTGRRIIKIRHTIRRRPRPRPRPPRIIRPIRPRPRPIRPRPRPRPILPILPRPEPEPESAGCLGSICPGGILNAAGFVWGRIQVNAAKVIRKCYIFTGCYIPDSKRHETHVGPSAGARSLGTRIRNFG